MSAAVSLCPAFAMRPARESDLAFILKPWLQAMRDEVSTRHIPDRVFFQKHGILVKRLLLKSLTIIAADASDPDHLYGFACADTRAIHWVYVKSSFRGLGIGRALATRVAPRISEVVCSHASHIFNDRKLVARHKLVYDPYVLLEN